MKFNTINLAVRFLLEHTALFSIAIWSWELSDGWIRYLIAPGIPITVTAIWATFTVPNDGSRSGKSLIATPGIIRLLIELLIFVFAVWALYELKLEILSLVFGAIVLFHYLVSYKRIIWLMSKKTINSQPISI
jgi:hypothetical protein